MFKNIRSLKLISALSLTNLIFSACVDVKDAEQAKSQTLGIKSSSTFSYVIPDSEDENHFEVHLSFPNKTYALSRKTILPNEDSTVFNNKIPDYQITANSVFIDSKIEPGTDYIYSIGTYDEAKRFHEEDRLRVAVPIDFKIESNFHYIVDRNNSKQISNFLRIRRLIFSRGAELITNGQDLTIKADKLISYEGKIRAFSSENAQASLETNGADAGTLTIFAKNAEGLLDIYLDGQQGGNGSPGRNAVNYKITSSRGTPGKNGGAGGELRYSLPSTGRIELHISTQGGTKGTGGPGGAGASWRVCPKTHDGGGCDQESTPASSKGDDGENGRDGRKCDAISAQEDSFADGSNFNCHP